MSRNREELDIGETIQLFFNPAKGVGSKVMKEDVSVRNEQE